MALYMIGLRSECLGSEVEWDPQPPAEFQQRHHRFWSLVSGMVEDEPGEYSDLPYWMTEDGTEQLESNN